MKPYDVEQAKVDLKEKAKNLVKINTEEITHALDAAIQQLEVQARAYEDMPRDIESLVRGSSMMLIEEFDPKKRFGIPDMREQKELNIAYARFRIFAQGLGEANFDFYHGHDDRKIPAKKHRVLVFFIPVED